MAASFDFRVPPDTDARLAELLTPRQYAQAQYQAVLRTTQKLKTLVSREIRAQVNLSKADLDSRYLRLVKPSGDPPFEGKVIVRSRRLPYGQFPYSATSGGVTVRISKTRTVQLRHAFEATTADTGHTGIFLRSRHRPSKGPNVELRTRSGKLKYRLTPRGVAGRLAITEETTLSLPDILQLDKVWASIQLDAAAELRKQGESQLKRFLKGDYTPPPAADEGD